MWIFWTAFAVLLLDQASKYAVFYGHVIGKLGYTGAPSDLAALKQFLVSVAARNSIPADGKFVVLSFTANDAALFGIGNGTQWAARLLASMTAVFLFLLLFFAIRNHKKMSRLSAFTYGLLIGGSIGNLYDRIAFGYVRDMIYAKFIDFPIFNIADSAICIAIALIVIETLFVKRDGLFDVIEDDVRWLFHLPTRQEAQAKEKERKAKRLSVFEEEIPEETDIKPEQANGNSEDPSSEDQSQ